MTALGKEKRNKIQKIKQVKFAFLFFIYFYFFFFFWGGGGGGILTNLN
jgi:hypothetical protein